MANTNILTFAIHKAYVSANADSSTPASWLELPLVKESTIEYSTQEAEVTNGEGKLFYQWFFGQRALARIRIPVYAFAVFERITGSPVSSAQGADMQYFGREEEISPSPVRLKVIVRAVNKDTNVEGYFHITVFKAQGRMPTVTARETTPGEFEIQFKALAATYDENGASIPESYGKYSGLQTTATP